MKYDAIIVGAGHNGLVAAAFLAKAGLRVLVLEKRKCLGGAAATEKLFPGFNVNTGAQDAGMFLPEIVDALDLPSHGLEFLESPVALFAPQLDRTALTLWHDYEKSQEDIQRLSNHDASKFKAYQTTVLRHLEILKRMLVLTPPDFKDGSYFDLIEWLRVGIKVRRSARRELVELLRVTPMSVKQFLDEWFENETVKAALGANGVIGSLLGPHSSGTTLAMLYQALGSKSCLRAARWVKGGIGNLSEAVALAAKHCGAEIRVNTDVASINVRDYQTIGVVLETGEEIQSKAVISNADPRRTFVDLVGAKKLGPQFLRKVRNIRFGGGTAGIHLALNDMPEFVGMSGAEQLAGHIQICPSLDALERAHDQAKYGRLSKRPFCDIVIPTVSDPSLAPAGNHLMSITTQYAPYHLRTASSWDDLKHTFADNVIRVVSEYVPNLSKIILDRHVMTPLDLEREYGLWEGAIHHGQMALDQLLCMRPVAGFGRYRTPIKNLYLCGAGTHPGGGITGAPGYNAAREALKDFFD